MVNVRLDTITMLYLIVLVLNNNRSRGVKEMPQVAA